MQLTGKLTSGRRLAYIAEKMVAAICLDAVAAAGGKNVADVGWGQVRSRLASPLPDGTEYIDTVSAFDWNADDNWQDDSEPGSSLAFNEWEGREPDLDVQGTGDDELGTNRPVPISDAIKILMDTAANTGSRLEGAFQRMGNYKGFACNVAAQKAVGRNLALATLQLSQSIYKGKGRPPRGIDKISTSDTSWASKRKGKFNGRLARHFPVGRPSLTEAEWREHYKARLKKKRKGDGGESKGGPTVPPTVNPRPSTKWDERPKVRQHASNGPHDNSTDLPHEFLEKLFEEMGKELGEHVGKFTVKAGEHLLKWLKELGGM